MSDAIRRAPKVRRDLVDIFKRYTREGGLNTARRFFTEAEATFRRLARRPGIGTRFEPDDPIFADLRYFPISRFKNYLVFYQLIEGGIEVLRVLHGARDIQHILADDFGVADDADDHEAAEGGAGD